MSVTKIVVSNGSEISVRKLGLFELDSNVVKDIPDRYTYEIKMANGKTYNLPYEGDFTLDKPNLFSYFNL